MQRAREQKEGPAAVEHRFLEIDTAEQSGQAFVDGGLRQGQLDADQHEGCGEAHEEQPDRVRQSDQDMVEPAEGGRQNEENGNQVENGRHRPTPLLSP